MSKIIVLIFCFNLACFIQQDEPIDRYFIAPETSKSINQALGILERQWVPAILCSIHTLAKILHYDNLTALLLERPGIQSYVNFTRVCLPLFFPVLDFLSNFRKLVQLWFNNQSHYKYDFVKYGKRNRA